MGKGSRNRQLHQQDRLENPQKYKKKKPMPKWLKSAISIVLLIAVVVGIGAHIFTKYGIIERNRIIVESKTGDYDINQQIAAYVAWKNIYSEASMEWLYYKYGIWEDKEGITDEKSANYISQEDYPLVAASYVLQNTLRDAIDATIETLVEWVAVCDAAKGVVELTDEDIATVDASIASLTSVANSRNYWDLQSFINDAMFYGMRVSDIRKAEEMAVLYNKYCIKQQTDYEKAATFETIQAFCKANPDDFYNIDYLTYTAETKELAEKLTAADVENADQFKELILRYVFDKNYKTAYNKHVTQVKVTEIYNSVKNLTDTDTSKALSDKLTELGAEAVAEYKKDNAELESALKDWLFNTKRKDYEVATFATKAGDALYIATYYGKVDDNTVKARVLKYDFVEGEAFGDDEAFKENILTYLLESKKETPAYPTVSYKDEMEKAKEFKTFCEEKINGADPAFDDIKKKFTDREGVKTLENMSNTTVAEKIDESLRDYLIGESPKKGEIEIYDDGTTAYVVLITAAKENEVYDIMYVTFEADTYYQVIGDLNTALDKVYPTKKTTKPVSDAKDNTFEKWISERGATALTSARKEFDRTFFEIKSTDSTTKVETVTYTVYMVIGTPMYLDETITVNGGYVSITGTTGTGDEKKNALQQAQEYAAALKGKTFTELTSALSSISTSSSPTVDSSLTREELAGDTTLQKWFFDQDHEKNTVAAVEVSSTTSIAYVAVVVDKLPAWQNEAKAALVNDQMTGWLEELKKSYTVNEGVLDKIGEPTPTTTAAK